MALLNRKQQIAIKTEVTEGTAEPLAAADAAFNIFESSFSPDIQQFERNPFRTSIGNVASIAGVKTATMSYTTELVGSGNHVTTAPPFASILSSCGFRQIALKNISITSLSGTFQVGETITGSVGSGTATVAKTSVTGDSTLYLHSQTSTFQAEDITGGTSGATATIAGDSALVGFQYAPTSEFNNTTATESSAGGVYLSSSSLSLFNDGLVHKMAGCRSNLTMRCATGEPMQLAIETTGPLISTIDDAMLTGITYPTEKPPTFLDAGFSVQGYSAVIDNLELTSGNDLQVRKDPNTTAGAISTKIVNRAATGSIDPEGVVIANEHNFFSNVYTNAEGVLETTIGDTAGNKFIISAVKAQYTNINAGERAGLTTNQIDLSLNESAGNDELVILAI